MRIIRAKIVDRNSYDPFQNLVIAVIKQAAEDYRDLGKKLNDSGSRLEKLRLENEMKAISSFFLSDWYCKLSGFNNGPLILEMLDQEVFGND